MKKLFTTTAISLLLASSVSAGSHINGADTLETPAPPGPQAAGSQAGDNVVSSARPDAADASTNGGQTAGAKNAVFSDADE